MMIKQMPPLTLPMDGKKQKMEEQKEKKQNIGIALNDDLLKETMPKSETEDAPKRNTKDDLISKIINCCADNELELDISNTKLRRMSKTELCKLLAQKIEEGVKVQMAEQVGCKKGASDQVIALGVLKMVHNICATTAEKGANMFLPQYGYEVDGFCESLKEPAVDQAIDACLEEIARDSDIMQYIESPYTRLMIAWSGALVTSVRRVRKPRRSINNVANMGPQTAREENSVQPRTRRRTAPREINSNLRSIMEDEKSV